MNRFPATLVRIVISTMLSLTLSAIRLPAQCRSDEILVGEDENNYYCKHKTEYAACIKRAGEQLRASKPACAKAFQQCLVKQRPGMTTAAADCGLGCLSSSLKFATCLKVCGEKAIYAEDVLDKCVDTGNACFGDALQEHRKNVEACKQ